MDITAIANQQAGAVVLETDVCIAGSGPAGMVMGLFLAKQGMNVIVLEQGAGFRPEFHEANPITSFAKLVSDLERESFKDKKVKKAMQSLLLFVEEEKLEQLLIKPLYKQDGRMNRMVMMALYKQAEKLSNVTILTGMSVKSSLHKNEQKAGVLAESLTGEHYCIYSKLAFGAAGERMEKLLDEDEANCSHLWAAESESAGLSDVM